MIGTTRGKCKDVHVPNKKSMQSYIKTLNKEWGAIPFSKWPEQSVKYYPDRYGNWLYLNDKAQFLSEYNEWKNKVRIVF